MKRVSASQKFAASRLKNDIAKNIDAGISNASDRADLIACLQKATLSHWLPLGVIASASEAIQTLATSEGWIASRFAPRNDVGYNFAIPQRG